MNLELWADFGTKYGDTEIVAMDVPINDVDSNILYF